MVGCRYNAKNTLDKNYLYFAEKRGAKVLDETRVVDIKPLDGDGSAGFDDDGSPEALAKLRPLNAYGWSKHAFDRRIARLAATQAPLPPQWAGLKFFNVYGPNEYHKGSMKSVVAHNFARVRAGEPDPENETGGLGGTLPLEKRG